MVGPCVSLLPLLPGCVPTTGHPEVESVVQGANEAYAEPTTEDSSVDDEVPYNVLWIQLTMLLSVLLS